MTMADFSALINALDEQRVRLYDHLILKGITSIQSSYSLTTLINKVVQIDNGIAQVKNGYELFINNTSLQELPAYLDLQPFTSMYKMCYGCTALTYVRQLETTNVTDMMWAFYGCSSLQKIDGLITDNAKSVTSLFHGCTALHTISHPLDFSSVTSQIDTTFTSCKQLSYVRFSGTINVNIHVNGCPKLTSDSLLSLLNALADGVTNKKCKLGSTNLAKLTDAQKAIATDKGWTLE